ncbi:MAG: Eco57I restriction-modification methylase domain-containing protein [Algoriphagus aquaeductus]|uniref:Eco57I restriction-modification methylase domain-containing protein n=1 Tax=Algoriphagus aquaeductus TaxID=475299 RepID=UPI0038794AE6
MALFQSSVLKKYLAAQEHRPIHEAFAAYLTYFHNPRIRDNIRAAKEEQFQEGFLRELFVKIFGYTINPEPDFNLTTELKNIKDSKKTDGAILKDGNALAVIELKGTDTKDLDKIRDQAFNYKNNQPECVYVITSNFEKLRFYIDNAVDYVEFNILAMESDQFKLMWLLLQKDNLLSGLPKKIKEESLLAEEQITKQLYRDYSAFKQELWQDLVAQNKDVDELLLYKKSQKLLDRFLFIFFAEDKGLLPPNSIMEIVNQWVKLKELDEYRPIYERFKKYFGYLNTGRVIPGKPEIHAYNGGLFAPDPILDTLTISDSVLEKHVRKLTEYDFESEVDTNILGHIFEHSLNDIENVRAQLAGQEVDKSKTKRKRDGVFYTPKYITKYIVDNTLGRLCTEKKAELQLVDEEFSKYLHYKTKEAERKRKAELKQKLDTYRNWLLQLTICDPACGSGAFLNQVLEFLIAEHRYVDELEAQLFDTPLVLPNVENHILENNIFGVDINEESVEIARLSLWLRTAKKGRKLSSLNSNIKVGNSLIDDPAVAGDLAFDWQAQFPQVFAKGGFDVVVGNPPYGVIQEKNLKDFFKSRYNSFQGNLENYCFFIELFINLTNKEEGEIGLIVPVTWLSIPQFENLRGIVLNTRIRSIVELPTKVFSDADLDTLVLICTPNKEFLKSTSVSKVEYPNINSFEASLLRPKLFDQFNWEETPDKRIDLEKSEEIDLIINKLRKSSIILKDHFQVSQGIVPYAREEMYKSFSKDEADRIVDERLWHSNFKKDEYFKKELKGEDVTRYFLKWNGLQWVKYGPWLARPRDSKFFTQERILVREITRGTKLNAAFSDEELYNNPGIINIISKDQSIPLLVVLGIINSSLMFFYHLNCSPKARLKTSIPKILISDVENFPLSQPNPDLFHKIIQDVIGISLATSKWMDFTNNLVSLIESKFNIDKPSTKLQNWPDLDFKGFLGELSKAKVKLSLSEEAEWMAYFTEQKAKALALQADITRLDREIDALVYELYGLTEEEIRIVEGN